MVRVEVPRKIYEKVLRAWPTRAWAWSEIVPGRTYRVHGQPWEWREAMDAEELLAKVREALSRK